MSDFIPTILPEGLDDFTVAYFQAAEFTDGPQRAMDRAPVVGMDCTPEEHQRAIQEWADTQWHPDAVAQGVRECAAFQAANARDIEGYGAAPAGMDFWFTRNGHGVGFWEYDYGTVAECDRLNAAAKAAGMRGVVLGSDGCFHFYPENRESVSAPVDWRALAVQAADYLTSIRDGSMGDSDWPDVDELLQEIDEASA